MTKAPLILAFDTAGPHCAAALVKGGDVLHSQLEPLARGQGERLMILLEEILTRHNKAWRDLSALGVGIGPGNFTGIRLSVAAARGLALALDIPAVGVSGCDARQKLGPAGATFAIPAPRDRAYMCQNDGMPILSDVAALPKGTIIEASPRDVALGIALVAAERWERTTEPPSPLYLRAPDAAPSRDAPPRILPG